MFLQGLALSSLRQRDIDAGRFQIRVAQSLLDGFQVCTASHMVGCHGVPQGMHTSTGDASLLKIFGHAMLNGAGADGSLELGDKQRRLTDLRPNEQIGGDRFAGFVIERNVLSLAAFAFHPDITHVVRVGRDALGDLHILQLKFGQLGESHTSLQKQLNDSGIARLVGTLPQEPLILRLGQEARLMVRNRWGNELLSYVVVGDAQSGQKVKQGFDTVGFAIASGRAIAASIHLSLVGFQVAQRNLYESAGATVFQKHQQVNKVVAVIHTGSRGEVAGWHTISNEEVYPLLQRLDVQCCPQG